jgi:hypothetical protein
MRILPAAAATLSLGMAFASPVFADTADPSVRDIYQAAEAGHLDQAQQMMDQVLRDHPKSGKAHYVQAELYAKEGKLALARSELGQAEALDPGLTHESARSVQELKAQLGSGARIVDGSRGFGVNRGPAGPHFPWGMALVFVLAIAVLWMLFRRRNTYSQYPTGGAPVLNGGPGTYGGPAGYGAAPMAGGGIGSNIAGGLASGLAVGAGVVAGEELAHHFLDGGAREGVAPQTREVNDDWQSQSGNSDMGGSDFGVSDGGGWDDSGGGGGGGDWS